MPDYLAYGNIPQMVTAVIEIPLKEQKLLLISVFHWTIVIMHHIEFFKVGSIQ